MASFALGLRGKSLLALVLACLLALGPAVFIGWRVVDTIRNHFGQAFARNTTLLSSAKIVAPVTRELAMSLRLADSEVTRQWLLDEDNPAKKALFFREAEGYRRDFRDHAYFIGNAASRRYYFNGGAGPVSTESRSLLNPGNKEDAWFFSTLRDEPAYNINVDSNYTFTTTKIWFNVVVHDGARRIGVAGAGVDLSAFLDDFLTSDDEGVTPMILDTNGAIQAHPDRSLIAMNSGAVGIREARNSVFGLLPYIYEREQVRDAMAAAVKKPGTVEMRWVTLNSDRQLLALTYVPELKWFVVNAIDLRSARVMEKESGWLPRLLVALAALVAALLGGFAYTVERLVLRPIRQLQHTAQVMAGGQYDVALPPPRKDEIGELSAAFGVMAQKVRSHTEELEARVQQRTHALERANSDMAAAHKKIGDSIDYASLIQRAILPQREMVSSMGDRHAVLWRPRDVVGGDFYVYQAGAQGCLIGVVDCAGHGVPGALMTMLAHAAIDQAMADVGMHDPAAVLGRADQIIRAMLHDDIERQAVATNMDVGLAYVDLERRDVNFAGAKIALYYSDGSTVDEVAGARRAIGEKRVGSYANTRVPLQGGRTFYMTTDGFLDQAGGDLGYGFGSRRFADMVLQHASMPLAAQGQAFSDALAAYQGSHAQRDDITMLCFRFD
ncbi:MAG: biofilm regulation protein phosphatase SiaA [Pseudomonadota bacterium]